MQTLLSGIQALMAVFPLLQTPPSFVQWSCEPHQWTDGPQVSGGQFHGTVQAECTFNGAGGGSYAKLRTFMIEDMEKQVKEIHSGPVAETYQGMPSVTFDMTAPASANGMEVMVRADLHFATDESTRLHYALDSKSIQGTGQAKLLRKLNEIIDVKNGTGANTYQVVSSMSFVIDKPGLVPVGVFKNQVVKKIEESIPEHEKTVIEKLAPQL